MKSKHVLVTGSDGFIGSHLTEALVRDGHNVRAFTYYNAFNGHGWLDRVSKDTQQSLDIRSGDIRDPFFVKDCMKGIDIVFHLAALIGIPYSYIAPDAYIETNIKGTLHILQAARESGVEKVLHTSTSEVYGTARSVPMTEEHSLLGQSPYAASKIGADHLALSFFHSFDLPVCIVRPFNTYGPRQSTRAFIPTVITQILKGQRELKLGSLSPTRDLNFVEDTVNGFLAIAACEESHGETFHLSSGFEISMGEVAHLIGKTLNKDLKIIEDQKRVRPLKSEVLRLFGDNTKTTLKTGWKPKYGGLSGLEKGLKLTAEWFGNPNHLTYYKNEGYTV
ncbi:MAG: NAD-dependent 4,6-dehydratase LegB [Bdellovibrionales bacterium]|nr:NAD-dependent 4,6-dehydratase LegB [Bdellovibrionales bacterium]